MATWNKSLSLIPPANLPLILSSMANLTSASNTVLSLAEAAANAASAFYSQELDPATIAAQALVQQMKDFVQDTFSAGGYKIIVHPFIPGVGTGAGVFRSLSFPNCVYIACREFDDRKDKRRPVFSSQTQVELISIIAGAPSPSLFVSTIKALNALLSLKELRLAMRRMEQAMKLEKERFVKKSGSRLPDWTSWQFRDFEQIGDVEKIIMSNLAMVEGYINGGESAFDAAADLITKKKNQLTKLGNNLNNALAMFSGGLVNAGVYTLYTTGMGSQAVKQSLSAANGGAGHELSFSAGVTLVAPYPALNSVKEILQL